MIELNSKNSLKIIDNRYQVKLPLKQNVDLTLGDFLSCSQEICNFRKKISCKSFAFCWIQKNIEEYLSLCHAKIVEYQSHSLRNGSEYFIAHHPVDKITTKLRVVFDGSMQTNASIAWMILCTMVLWFKMNCLIFLFYLELISMSYCLI